MNSCYVIYDPNDICVKNRVIFYDSSEKLSDTARKNGWGNTFIKKENMLTPTTHWDYLFWKVINVEYASETDAEIVETNDLEKEYIKELLSGVEIRLKKYLVEEYNDDEYVSKRTYYYHDNGDGTYTGKLEEIIYTYSEIESDLLESHNTKTYYLDGTERTDETFNYYTNEEGSLIVKKEE